MTRMTGGGALVEMLRRHGVDTIFALPGVQNDALFVAFYDAGEAMRVIHTRHEQGAAYMAFGYARASGKVGAYAVVPGPGLLNTTAALATAYATNAPVLCISGQIASDLIGRGFGLLHEIPDQLGILRRLTKWAARIEHPTQTGKLVNEAFRQLRDGRPRPVGLEIPPDVLALETEVALPAAEAPPPAAEPDPELIDKAAALLADAKKPLIFVGSGAVDAGRGGAGDRRDAAGAGRQLHRRQGDRQRPPLSRPAGARRARAVARDRCRAGGRHPPASAADALGRRPRPEADPHRHRSRRDHPRSSGRRSASSPTPSRRSPPSTARSNARNIRRSSRQDELEALKARTLASLADKLGPQCEYLQAIRAELPDDGIYVEDLTQVGYVGRMAFPVYHPRTYIHSGYQGTLGFGFATALGAKVGRPDLPVVSVSGDGGFMYNVQELSTAVRHGIDIVAIVFADGAYGNVRRMQKEDYGNRLIGVDLLNPQFPKMAESFGAAGVRTTTPEGLRRELAAALKRRGTTLIEVAVGEMPDPWKVMLPPRVRGVR